jgi:hypothetical protein
VGLRTEIAWLIVWPVSGSSNHGTEILPSKQAQNFFNQVTSHEIPKMTLLYAVRQKGIGRALFKMAIIFI